MGELSVQTKRKSNIELLRVISMLMVITLHSLGRGALKYYETISVGYALFWFMETLSYVAVNLFILISGYFMIKQKAKPLKIVKLLFQIEFYSLICLVIAKLVFHEQINLKDLIYIFFPFTSNTYWFASSYAILLVISPFLNKAILSMERRQHLTVICVLLILFCVIPSFTFWSYNLLSGGYDFVWFTVLYFIASYIRLYSKEEASPSKKNKYILSYFAVSALCLVIRIIFEKITSLVLSQPHGGLFYIYNSIFIFPASLCLFMAFKNLEIKSKFISKLSVSLGSVCFGAYLATENPYIREPLWEAINLPRFAQHGIFAMLGCTAAAVILLFAMGCLIEYIRLFIFKIIHFDNLISFLEKKFKALKNKPFVKNILLKAGF